jgi:hypothetical protein
MTNTRVIACDSGVVGSEAPLNHIRPSAETSQEVRTNHVLAFDATPEGPTAKEPRPATQYRPSHPNKESRVRALWRRICDALLALSCDEPGVLAIASHPAPRVELRLAVELPSCTWRGDFFTIV